MTEDCYVRCRPIVFEARHPWRPPAGAQKRVEFCSGQNCRIEVDADGELTGLETQRDND
jgi:hypothetical protein